MTSRRKQRHCAVGFRDSKKARPDSSARAGSTSDAITRENESSASPEAWPQGRLSIEPLQQASASSAAPDAGASRDALDGSPRLDNEARELAKIMEALLRQQDAAASSSLAPESNSEQMLKNMGFISTYIELLNAYDKLSEDMLVQCRKECEELRASVKLEMSSALDDSGRSEAAHLAELDNALEADAAHELLETMDDAAMQEALRIRYREAAERLQTSDQAPSRWRGNLPKEATQVFRAWALQNLEDPYPTDSEKVELATTTGVPLKQITNWFINYRKRFWKQDKEIAS
mmetsp:Transcript_5071/g.13634  ORF Transcript_5071/g.13634 Transcript_5071/m.13634 type:complete len:290 (-) Transcript_5071:649-1518(-)|eukprot:CAMPEP_0185842006 /NCGR_PEP_ID=MMETSP1353-20130828/18188_1 /TAXON_ID=1077150 /ORGANISM="Erythrolobus australicus, Strain CCMP3124" /LENGTH=289 /DNA_ID=CAMNT_0028541501 /DNA_START=207 /DNA_END=1076 /DNA_ORIENTATION=+